MNTYKMHRIKTLLIGCFFLMAGVVQSVEAQKLSTIEQLQAAYLYNFAKYIQWPTKESVFVIGVYGKEPMLLSILQETLKGKKIGGKDLVLKNIKSVEEAATCHILYLPQEDSKILKDLVAVIAGKKVLLVTEDDLIKKGAMISFVEEDEKLQFKLKKSALLDAGLLVSEGLMRLAIPL